LQSIAVSLFQNRLCGELAGRFNAGGFNAGRFNVEGETLFSSGNAQAYRI
jgi:hypothetical protein